MASIFKPKRSNVVGRVPTTADLVEGEIGVNIPDSKIYINTGGVISVIADSAAGGAGYQVLTIDENPTGTEANWDIVGPVCETGDFLAKNRKLSLTEGDYLAIMSAGAYGFSMSSNYNSRPRVAEVMVSETQHSLVRERENIADLFAKEHIVP